MDEDRRSSWDQAKRWFCFPQTRTRSLSGESSSVSIGINCAVFRNESRQVSSELIENACELAWARWPGERLYTYVHTKFDLPVVTPLGDNEIALTLLDKGKKRNKLYRLEQRYSADRKHKKAANIRKYNLGEQALSRRTRKHKGNITRIINTAINQVVAKQKPGLIITEKLDFRGPAKNKSMSRRVSLWHRSILKERISFKALAAGCRHEHVNPAYTSQTCPACGYLDSKNRHGDAFKCLNCGLAGAADWIAAINLKARYADREITLYTPYKEVKAILLRRFQAHLENRNASTLKDVEKIRTVTVSARTSDRATTRLARQSKNETKSNIGRNEVPLFV